MKRVPVVLTFLLVLIPAMAAGADEVYPIVFPVDGPNHYTDTFGAPRAGHTHEGTDILADKMTPVVAAAAGTVGWVSDTCCAMELVHDDGYRSRYIHLNNDTPGTDDGQGWGFAPGIESGVHVEAGQLIGYVGDSGNAEATSSHLHFELRYPSGEAFNSYPSLLVATPPGERVTWYVGVVDNGSLDTSTDTITAHVPENGGLAVVGDFDGDGFDEVAVGGGAVPGWEVVALDGSSDRWSTVDGSDAQSVLVGDFDGDGDDDIASFSRTNTWSGFRAEGGGFSAESWGRFGGVGWGQQLVGDVDGDGADEILSFHPASRNWWVTNLAGSTFTSAIFTSYGTPSGWQVHLTADIDGDGEDELVSFHPSNGTWWGSDLGRRPSLIYDVSTNSGWQHLVAGDVDGDGTEELAMFHPSNGTWWVVDQSTKPARVRLWGRFSTRSGWVSPVVADVDGDGQGDVVVRHEPSGRVWAVRGGGEGVLDYLGVLVAGRTAGEWSVSHTEADHGFLALTRD